MAAAPASMLIGVDDPRSSAWKGEKRKATSLTPFSSGRKSEVSALLAWSDTPDPAQGCPRVEPKEVNMFHARRLAAIVLGCAVWCVAAATAVQAKGVPDPHPVTTSAAGTSTWQFLAFVALSVLLAVAIVGLGHSLSQRQRLGAPQRSERSRRSQPPTRA